MQHSLRRYKLRLNFKRLTHPSSRTPLKKVATPTDIANQIVMLSSNRVSGHVTGQVLMIEGGMEG